jgi:hypothetical protein
MTSDDPSGPNKYQLDTTKAVTPMTTERHAWTSLRAAVPTAERVPPTTCGCGQDLDVCAGSHCPRCGTLVHLRAA